MSFLEKNREKINNLLSSILESSEKSISLELGVVHFSPACEVIAIHIKTDKGEINRVLYRGIIEKALSKEPFARERIKRVINEAVRLTS